MSGTTPCEPKLNISERITIRNEIVICGKPCRLSSAYLSDAPLKKIIQSCIDILELYEFEYIQKSNTWHIYYVPNVGEMSYILIELFRVDTESAQFVIDCRTLSGNKLCGIQLKKQLINMINDVYVVGSQPINLNKSSILETLTLPPEIIDEFNKLEYQEKVYNDSKKDFIKHMDNIHSIEHNLMHLRLFLTEYSDFTNTDNELINNISEFISTKFTYGYKTIIYILRDIIESTLDLKVINEILCLKPEFKLYIDGIIDGTITHEMYHIVALRGFILDISISHILIWRLTIKFSQKLINKLN